VGQVLSVSELEKTFEVRRTAFSRKKTLIRAVDHVSFDLEERRSLGVVGESGSGKSTLARCLVLLEKPDGGVIRFYDKTAAEMSNRDEEAMRRSVQIIFQDPYSSLNPRKNVLDAIAEPLRVHGLATPKTVVEEVVRVLAHVGLGEDFLGKYPHEMSGGQRQRVAIGRAVATRPSLLIADEPVSSLDVSIQAQIINLFKDIKEESGISMIFVSHDLNVVRFMSDDIIVMYKGKILEMGRKDAIFSRPLHPYTRMLIRAARGELCDMKESDETEVNEACVYYRRCEFRDRVCLNALPDLVGSREHSVSCLKVANSSL